MQESAESVPSDIAAASPHDTVDEIVRVARRPATPIRTTFLQKGRAGATYEPGPLASFVSAGDRAGLVLYLLLLTKASAGEWEARLPAAVWARGLGLYNPTGRTATSTISRAWSRLEKRQLISRTRRQRWAEVQLLREDGTGEPYTHPGTDKDRHLKLPQAFWTSGPAGASDQSGQRWYEVLTMPEIAMLLVALSLGDQYRFPADSAPAWYGISADSAARGLRGLADHQLLEREKRFKVAPLAPQGYTAEYHHTLLPPFGPKGVLARAGRRGPAS